MPHPFPRVEEEQIDPEDLMINTDFISEMIPVISQNYSEKNSERLENSIAAFDHLMGVVLDSIDAAYANASEGQIHLVWNKLPFSIGIKLY